MLTDPKALSTQSKFYPLLGILFVTIQIACNLTGQKLTNWHAYTYDVATWAFPLAYVISNMLTEIYGYAYARRLIWSALACNILFALFIQLTIALPPSAEWPWQAAYAQILGSTPRILGASIIASFCGEFTDDYLQAKLKLWLHGHYYALRYTIAIVLALWVDSLVFIPLAFAGNISLGLLANTAITECLIKISIALTMLPLIHKLVGKLKQLEQMDIYDRDTKFNPFYWH